MSFRGPKAGVCAKGVQQWAVRHWAVLQVLLSAFRARADSKLGRTFLHLTLGLFGLHAPGNAWGQTKTQPTTVAVQVHTADRAQCGSEPTLQARIRQRTKRLALSRAEPTAVSVRAELLRPSPLEPYLAVLTIEESGDATRGYRREIRADSCDELLDAVAVVVVVRLDPPSAAATSASTSASEPRLEPSVGSSRPGFSAPEHAGDSTYEVSLGAGGALASGPAPELLPGLALTIGVRAVLAQPGFGFHPALRLSGAYHGRAGMEAELGQATLVLTWLRLEVCPLSYQSSSVAWLWCGFGDVGELQARGRATYAPAELTRVWGVLGGSSILSYFPHRRLSINAAISLGATLTRYAFHFEDERLHQTAPMTTGATLGLAFGWE